MAYFGLWAFGRKSCLLSLPRHPLALPEGKAWCGCWKDEHLVLFNPYRRCPWFEYCFGFQGILLGVGMSEAVGECSGLGAVLRMAHFEGLCLEWPAKTSPAWFCYPERRTFLEIFSLDPWKNFVQVLSTVIQIFYLVSLQVLILFPGLHCCHDFFELLLVS